MKRFNKTALFVLAFMFLPVLVFVRYMEASNKFDALGWWYSLIVTAFFSVPPALLIAGVIYLFSTRRKDGA